ncbi:5'-methylthioadenosine/S-adenosylhomocysteine nucleosidase [uncultured Intestinimonas sp.]|uniref:5'-methylthioadenosine/S-adenosylhomocysteine nucleosidase n=1 Tax=uncultured Intestinimonas sp. TaxID=1689265 RepID=UPI0025E8CBF9|nr:5'-methylthioadenosine/S-adenosylhomocysteine nucleosidase [uncultured Intestinimonas sp.]
MTGPILIQGAMDVETDRTVERLENCREETIAGFRFWQGRYAGLDLAVSCTEVGMVAAAAATALGIQRFSPSLVLNQGTAGAHRDDLHVGDVVVGRTCVDIHSVLIPKRGAGEGMDSAAWTLWDFDADTPPVVLNGDAHWAERFEATPYAEGRVLSGRLGTGDVFNREHDRILWLRAQAGEDCEDMESLAAYRVCRRFGVPCLGLRIISNNELTGEAYRREVGEDLQDFILSVLAR